MKILDATNRTVGSTTTKIKPTIVRSYAVECSRHGSRHAPRAVTWVAVTIRHISLKSDGSNCDEGYGIRSMPTTLPAIHSHKAR